MDAKSEEFKQYREEILALRPINTNEKARQYREVYRKYHPLDPKQQQKQYDYDQPS